MFRQSSSVDAKGHVSKQSVMVDPSVAAVVFWEVAQVQRQAGLVSIRYVDGAGWLVICDDVQYHSIYQ